MRFLIDEDLPRSTGDLLMRYGHDAIDIRDIGLRGFKDSEVAAYAQKEGLSLLTGDYDFSDIRKYPPGQYNGLVVLKIPWMATASYILSLLESFLKQNEVVVQIPGKLAIVEMGRIRLRSR